MAKMVPAWIDPGGKAPPGEVILFEALKFEPGTESWTVLHSIDIPNHIRNVQGEADFLIIAPSLGVLCLEVKSHQSASRGTDGLWRLGGDPPSPRSPFRQASDAMHSIVKRVKQEAPTLGGVPFVSGVCFPRCGFDVAAAEWEPWQVVDERLLRARPLATTLTALFSNARGRYAASPSSKWFREEDGLPTEGQCESIVRILRPAFEVHRSPKARREERETELKHYTEEQFLALDGLESNPRVLLKGQAGTGKTLLGLEAARRAQLAGSRTLFCCFNRMLGGWLKHEAEPLRPEVWTGTFHALMLEIADVPVPENAGRAFWEEELPASATDALLSGHPRANGFDLVILDEAQDLARDQYLDVLDLVLEGGLDHGRVLAFGDFARQAIYGSTVDDPEGVFHARMPNFFTYTLGVNCRNRPRIGALVSRLGGLDDAYRRFRRVDDGIEPDLYFYDTAARQLELLENQLEKLRGEGFSLGDITVLSTLAGDAVAARLPEPWKSRVQPADQAARFHARYCSVHAFKGLEAPAIILTDMSAVGNESEEALLYVGMTRATDRLIILSSEKAKEQLRSLFLGEGGRR